MKKLTLQINLVDNEWTLRVNSQPLSWLFRKMFNLKVDTRNRRGLKSILAELEQAYKKGDRND